MQSWRENPDGPENSEAAKQHQREVFALKQEAAQRSAAAALMGAACKGKPKTISDAERERRRLAMVALNKSRAKARKARFVVLDTTGHKWAYEAESAQHAVTLARHDGIDATTATQETKGEQ